MFLILQVVSVFLVSVTMSLALAHALEFPGKRRLDKATYQAVQAIYYPGFTFGGFSEGLGMIATLGLLMMTPGESAAFKWTLIGFIALVVMHVVYWVVTHPVNKFWLKDQDMKGFGDRFFRFDPLQRGAKEASDSEDMWKRFRNRWEYSHVIRAILAAVALISLIIAVALE